MRGTPVTASILALTLLMPAASLAGPNGKWRVGDGTAIINVQNCGANLCGTIDAVNERGAKDDNNPDPKLRARPLVGLPILSLQKNGENLWTGLIYNPKDGQSYAARLTQKSEAALTLEGCVQGTNLCGEDNWTRAQR